jgi:hypothetical protein
LGVFEKAEAGGPYVTGCTMTKRTDRECVLDNLLADRGYFIRVSERCTDPFANSAYKRRYLPCQTLTMPAKPSTNVTANNEQLYTFDVSWLPGDPKACIFVAWEVQVIENGTSWADVKPDAITNFGCMVTVREKPNCTVSVGLNSGSGFYYRMREACSVRRLFSPWVYVNQLVMTLLPIPAGRPENFTLTSPAPFEVFNEWLPGIVGE